MTPDRPHVLVLNQYLVPDTAVTGRVAFEIAAAIAAAGNRVTFIAGQPSYLPGQPPAAPRESCDGVEIHRLTILGRRGRSTRIARFSAYLVYLVRALLAAWRICRSDSVDTIICFHNPPFLPLVGAALAREHRPFVCIVQDIHPDVIAATGWISLPRAIIAGWEGLNRWAYRRAARVVVITEDMRAALIEKGVEPGHVVTIPLWAQPELTPGPADPAALATTGLKLEPELLTVLFAGNMGLTQRLEPAFAAALMLIGEPVRFVFAGSGINWERWRADAARLPNVTFLPHQPEPVYRALVAAADVGLVTLAPSLERLVVPSRAFPLLAAGTPLLVVMSHDCELGRFVTEHRCGACVQTPEQFATVIRDWIADRSEVTAAGARARRAYTATRERTAMTRRYVDLVASVSR